MGEEARLAEAVAQVAAEVGVEEEVAVGEEAAEEVEEAVGEEAAAEAEARGRS